jgi:hypothetical protein
VRPWLRWQPLAVRGERHHPAGMKSDRTTARKLGTRCGQRARLVPEVEMLAVVLAVLGVPIWLVAGMLLAGAYSRRRYRQQPDVFTCYLRVVDGEQRPFDATWGRRPSYGRWLHDVLLLSRGLALVRLLAIPVATRVSGPDPLDGPPLRGLEGSAVTIRLRTDDGTTLELAVSEADVARLGPPRTTDTEVVPRRGT